MPSHSPKKQIRRQHGITTSLGIACPGQPMRSSLLIDGSRWDGSDPFGYARSFSLHALGDLPDARVGA